MAAKPVGGHRLTLTESGLPKAPSRRGQLPHALGSHLASTSVPGPLAAPFAQAKIVCEDRRSFWTPQAMPIRLNAGRPMMLGPLDTWPGSVQF